LSALTILVLHAHRGILTSHVEFGGRAEWGANFGDQSDFDCNGHGTHVAGIVAGHRYGVAKNATVIAVNRPPTTKRTHNLRS
jgi:subtilisin family serine protease